MLITPKPISSLFFQFLLSAALVSAEAQDPPQPNVIIILADDVGYAVPTINGGQSYSTPNLDSMARHGINFTHCEASPVCSPSRFMLLTGKYNFRNYSNWGYMSKTEKTIGNMMKDAGYQTGFFGKLQLDGDDSSIHNWGFEQYTVFDISGKPFNFRYKNPTLLENGAKLPDSVVSGKYCDDILTDKIFDFIDANHTQPFFALYSMSLAHIPYSPTPDDTAFASWDPKLQVSDTSFFPSMIRYMDKKIGMILDKLRTDGLDQNTIVIFSGDNGTPRNIVSIADSDEIEGGKGLTTESGTHVPLIAYWPGHTPDGSVNDDLVGFVDFFSTLADISKATNLANYRPLDGKSFLPQLLGEAGDPNQWLFCHYDPNPGFNGGTVARWIRNKTYKLYDSTNSSNSGNFYNIVDDKDEKSPLTNAQLTPGEIAIRQQFWSVLDTMGNAPPAPVLSNRFVTNIAHTSVTIGATIISDGGASLTERGSILALAPSIPHLVSLRLPDTATVFGPGTFTQVRSNLKPQTRYVYNLYAMNSNKSDNTGYAIRGTFLTLSAPPIAQPASFTATTSYCSLNLTWKNAKFPLARANKAGYLLVYSTGAPSVVANPNGKKPSQVINNGIVVSLSSTILPALPATTVTIPALSSDSVYHLLLIPYTWDGVNDSSYNYLTAGALTTTQTPRPSILMISSTTTSPSCFGGDNGTITASGVRGTPPYLLNLNSGSYDTVSFFGNLTAGTYLLTAKDAKGCFASKTAIIKSPLNLLLTVTTDSASCRGSSNGSINATGSGGSSPYLYNLNGGVYGNSSIFNSLVAGSYIVAVKDKNGCIASRTAIVRQPLPLVLNLSVDSVSCKGASDGSITASGSGGILPYLYNLDGGSYSTSSTFSSLAYGNYTLTIKDLHSCITSRTILVRQPLQLSLAAMADSASCIGASDGSITITGAGGTPPYLYSLNSGNYVASSTFGSLTAGSYLVALKDKNGCIVSKTIAVAQSNQACTGSFASSQNNGNLISNEEIKIRIIPNPSSSEFQLVLNNNLDQEAVISVHDMYGQLVYSAKGSGIHTYRFGARFSSGIYLVQVKYGFLVKEIKIVKAEP